MLSLGGNGRLARFEESRESTSAQLTLQARDATPDRGQYSESATGSLAKANLDYTCVIRYRRI